MLMELASYRQGNSNTIELSARASTQGVSLAATFTVSSASFWGPAPDDQSPYDREKAALERLRPSLARYAGHYVAVHNGRVVDYDLSRNELVQRFFREHGEGASLCIGFIGTRPSVRIPTPFIRRSS